MAITSVLVHVEDSEDIEHRVGVAAGLAKAHGAHLTAIYAMPNLLAFPIPGGDYISAEIIEAQAERAEESAASARARFEKLVAAAGLSAEWREAEGYPANIVSLHAKYADITVMGQSNPDDPRSFPNPDLSAETALTAGRPILVVPYIGVRRDVGRNVLIAWNGSREATRAVNDALPILERAEKVTVLAVNPRERRSEHGDVPSADIALHLARHGVKAEAAQTTSSALEIGDTILSRLADLDADLLVMGAYGHSRMREFLLGGVTRELLHHMTVPVLLSH